MGLTIREANAACELIDWARGRRLTDAGNVITDEDATGAARLLAAGVNRSLQAGPHPEHVTLRWTRTVRERLTQLLSSPAAVNEQEARAVRDVLDLLDRIDRQAARADDARTVLISALGAATGRRPLRRDGTEITARQAAEAATRLDAAGRGDTTDATAGRKGTHGDGT